MKYFIFHKEDDCFDDILKDLVLKRAIREKMQWPNYLLLGISENYAEAVSYAVLKYGDYMIKQTDMFVDRSPAMFKEYWPKDLPSKEVLAKRRGF